MAISTSLKWSVVVVLLLVLQIVIFPLNSSATSTSPRGQEDSSCRSGSVPSIQASLQFLTKGKAAPRNVPQQQQHKTDQTKHNSEKQQKRKDNLQQNKGFKLFKDGPSRFKAKHLLSSNGDNGTAVVDSFKALTGNSTEAKNYLIELNLKLYKGGVLPTEDAFEDWFANMEKKRFLTIADANMDELMRTKKKIYGGQNKKRDLFQTIDKYNVTDITFHPTMDIEGKVAVVNVEATKFKTHLTLGLKNRMKPVRLERVNRSSSELLVNPITICSFTTDELQTIAVMASEFWEKLGLPEETKPGRLLNEDSPSYIKFKLDYETELSRVRNKEGGSTNPPPSIPGACLSEEEGPGRGEGKEGPEESRCAIYLKPNGDVDSVHPAEFIEEYKRADADGKRKLSEVLKDNLDKIDARVDLSSSKEKVSSLLQLETVKQHVNALNVASQVESGKLAGGKNLAPSAKSLSSAFDSLQTQLSNVKARLSNSKAGKVLASLASSKLGTGFSPGLSGRLGKLFLAKTVINVIIAGDSDSTSQAIVGARVGWEVGTGAAVWAAGKFFKESSKMGKAAKFLGEVAGPIGAALDIGLSVWSLTKAAGRLSSAKNQYDRNDAIVDIVSDCVDIAVAAATTTLSIAFPPAAPILMGVSVVIDLLNRLVTALFKGFNNVARINSEVPLLGFEKGYVFSSRFFDWFGTRQQDYIDQLLEENAANELAVQQNLKFLEENPAFLGIVFPSRTLAYDGGCSLTLQICGLKNLWGCTKWATKPLTLATGCDKNRQCGSKSLTCSDYWEGVTALAYFDFKCICDKTANISFSFPRRNSLVDFRAKQPVFWERAVPKEVENGEFQCKPGSTTDQGYRVSEESSRVEYLCENAIALIRRRMTWFERILRGMRGGWEEESEIWANNSQVMLYSLEDGHDRVYLDPSSSTPNLFLVGSEGRKEFVGGGARNEFMFDGDCTKALKGSLAGGRSTADAITILSNCSRGGEMRINFASGTLKDSRGNVDMGFSSIEEVTGRKGEGDHVTTSCGLRKVVLQGGSSTHPDRVDIGQYSKCAHNLTLVMTNYTIVTSRASRGDINLLVDSSWISVSTSAEIHPKSNLRMNIIFLNTSSHQVFLELSSKDQTGIQGTISKLPGKRDQFSFNFMLRDRQDVPLLFTETPEGTPYSVLVLSPEAPLYYHTLPATPSPQTRRSAPNVETIFDVMGSLWTVTGGDENDEFVLHTIPTFVDGGNGEDRVRLNPDFKSRELIDLTGSTFSSIENFYGAAGVACKVKTACDTKLVVPQGGSKTEPDVVTVPPSKCNKRELQIVAKGHTRVVIEGEIGPADRDSVTVVVVSEKESPPLQLQLEALSGKNPGLVVLLSVSHKNWTVKQCSRNLQSNTLVLALDGSEGESVEFKLSTCNSTYLSSPYIQLSAKDSKEPPGRLVIEEESATPKVIFHLDQQNSSSSDEPISVTGFQGISNLFRVFQNPSSSWNIAGGGENDVFSLSHVDGVFVDGGGGNGEDTIILELHPQDIGRTFTVNLEKEEMFLLGSTQKRGRVSRVHHVIGREGHSDIIHVDCHTKSVAGRGGHGGPQGEDVIFISGKTCGKSSSSSNPPQTSVDLAKHSKVVNSGSPGVFTYYVQDIMTSQLELIPTAENTHFVKFAVHPWQVIRDIRFSETDHVLGLKLLKSGGGTSEEARILAFPMFLQTEGSSGGEGEHYVNPILEFHPPDTFVRSDIRVLGEGVTTSTITIQGPPEEEVVGLPVDLNRFLINITTKHADDDGGGGGVIRGGAENSNQFWLFSLENELDVLDGGHCTKYGACTNYLQFGEKFHSEEPLELDCSLGNLKTGSKVRIQTLRNFQQVVGRSGNDSFDSVIVSCKIKQVSEFESVVIPAKGDEEEDQRDYDLIIGIGKETRVQFQSRENSSSSGWNDTFHYRFTVPRSFELDREDDSDLIGPTHNYYLPFKMDDLEELGFDQESECLRYKICGGGGEEYSIEMIEHVATEQFYLQPVVTTQDGFLIQVAIDGTILLSLGAGSSFPSLNKIKSAVVPAFGHVASKLGVTILVQTDKELLYVGHRKVDGDRNVLQNVGYSVSHLVGGGADDTIYEIVSLEKDVYIYPGYHQWLEDDDETKVNRSKQTIDLTDVVVPIRVESGAKYVPEVERVGDDIVVSMAGWESRNPGKIFIVDGAVREGRDSGGMIQVLLNAAVLDLVGLGSGVSKRHRRSDSEEPLSEETPDHWGLSPRPIQIPEGMVYSLAPEDLEDGHLIQLENYNEDNTDNGNESGHTPHFKVIRNGTDLYMTDVMGAAVAGSASDDIMEVTTIVISDFFKEKNAKESPEKNGTEVEHNNQNHKEEAADIWENNNNNLPDGLLAVTISLPGLSLLLNDSEILNTSHPTEWKKVPRGQILQWELALYAVEQQILQGYPDIERAFTPEGVILGETDDDIRVDFLMLLFIATAGSLVVITLGAIGIALVCHRRWRLIGEYRVNRNEAIEMANVKL